MAAACPFLLSGSGRGGITRVGPVNRIAVHQSIVHPLDPVGLVRLAEQAGIDSVGLHVATTPEVELWWVKGIGAEMLRDLVAALLAARVTVLDVSPRTDSPAAVAEAVVELGELLGYVRVPAHELGDATAPGLLATLPPQVPVVIGEPPAPATAPTPPVLSTRPAGTDDAGAEQADEAELLARLTAWRAAVDALLRHPAASDR